jgi:hypothetical protein
MTREQCVWSGARRGVTALALGLGLSLVPVAGLAQPSASDGWTAPRTAWGAPDIGGVWNSSTVTPLERPEAQADKEFLTEEEAAAIEQRVVEGNALANAPSEVRTEPLPAGGNVGAYNSFWIDRGTTVVPTRRTSLVIDPPNGRLPTLTPEHERFVNSSERQRLKAVREGEVPADSYVQFDYGDRCIWYRGVPSLPTAYNNNYQIVQTEDVVAIVQEHIHDVRFIHLDGRSRIDARITQFGGHSLGHWEGDTLVVETAGFGDRAYLFASGAGPQGGTNWDLSPEHRVVERFTRVAPGVLDYQFTVEDPNVWTRPWTGSSPWALNDQPIFEYACHEGNYGLMNILAGSRQEELAGQKQ